MAQNTTMNNVTANNVVISMNKEEVEMKTKKADLVAMLEKYLDHSNTVETVEEEKTEKVSDMKQKYMEYMDAKWDKLVKALATEYIKQSRDVNFALFYKNTRSVATKAPYLVKSNRLWGCTANVIKTVYGDSYCNEKNIQESLNAMVARGYLNFQLLQGYNGSINVVFNATSDQIYAMYELSK